MVLSASPTLHFNASQSDHSPPTLQAEGVRRAVPELLAVASGSSPWRSCCRWSAVDRPDRRTVKISANRSRRIENPAPMPLPNNSRRGRKNMRVNGKEASKPLFSDCHFLDERFPFQAPPTSEHKRLLCNTVLLPFRLENRHIFFSGHP